jgi:predicted nucleic acid-binding Zn ribbon protein
MKKAGEILKQLMAKISEEKGSSYEQSVRVIRDWEELAGIDIAAHTKIVDVERDHLLVEVDHPGWMQLVQMKEGIILKKISKLYPELHIRGLKLFLWSH